MINKNYKYNNNTKHHFNIQSIINKRKHNKNKTPKYMYLYKTFKDFNEAVEEALPK